MNTESKTKDVSSPPTNEGGSAVPSGFILKLFQMVNGAPDEVISWTPSGDAFIIGSDLNRLESETLPQYFRHNRFQSLVRQLNFYSFRKINRERNVWIYKHKLFHRDRPEDLHQVRRRTCPGVDGRKQRFSRYSARKLGKFDDDKGSQSSDDEDSSVEGASGDEAGLGKKRRGSTSSVGSLPKRARRLWQADEPETYMKVDTSLFSSTMASPTSVFDAYQTQATELLAEDDSSTNKKNEKMEMLERSMIVSEVATKLEEYARKALKGRGSSRGRRTGVVTPPYGSSGSSLISTNGLITYDDEFTTPRDNLPGVVSDGEESVETLAPCPPATKQDLKEFNVPPVSSKEMASQIVEEITNRASANFYDADAIKGCALIAELLMTTAPGEETAVSCKRVANLLESSERLAADFHNYRAALHPESAMKAVDSAEHNHSLALRRALESMSSRLDALSQFKIFAVNLIYKLLGKNGSFDVQPFSKSEYANLLNTADAWSKSVGLVL